MNNLIPALIAVLLAEIGGRSALFVRLPRLALAAAVLGVAVGVSAIAGAAMAPAMTAQARALLLGIALIFSGAGQFRRSASSEPPVSLVRTLLLVWQTGVPFLAFAFAIWKASALGAMAGALAGFVGAVGLSILFTDSVSPAQFVSIRRTGGTLLLLVGSYSVFWALGLV